MSDVDTVSYQKEAVDGTPINGAAVMVKRKMRRRRMWHACWSGRWLA